MCHGNSRSSLAFALAALVLLVGTAGAQTTINVPGDYATIQAAIDAATAGDTIQIAADTYNERPYVSKSLTINGVDEATVIIDAGAAASGSYGFEIYADNVTVSNLTLLGDTSLSTPRYGFKPSNVANLTLTNVTASEFFRTGVDLLGVNGGTLTDVTSVDNNGHGLSVLDCNNVTITDLTVAGNGWQGVSVATWGNYSPLGTSGIVFTGINTFTDAFQLEMGDFNNPGVPPAGNAIITYSTDILDGADVTVQAGELAFAVHGEQDDAPDQVRIWLAPTLADAALLPAFGGPVGHFTGNGMFIEDLPADGLLHITPGCNIQAAIDFATAGDDIQIAAGTYEEQLYVPKDLTLTGAGQGVTTVLSPVNLTLFWTTSNPNYPIVFIDGATVTVSDLTVDGAGRGNANYRFCGIGFHNSGGVVERCELKDVRDTPFSGAQHGVAIYSWNDDLVARDIDLTDCDIIGFQKTAIALNAADTTPIDVAVTGNTLTGAGPTAVTAQNGVQVWGDLNTGVISGNTITGVAYDGSGWVGTSILNLYSDVDITENEIDVAHVGVYNIDGSGTIADNVMEITKYADYGWGIIASDPPEAVPSPFIDEGMDKGGSNGQRATLTVDVTGNTVIFVGPDNTGTYGIEGDAGYGPNDLDLVINDNLVSGFDVGIDIWQCQGSCDTGVFTSVDARRNNVGDNTLFGVRSNVDYLTVDAADCWWGDSSGPAGEGMGTGVPVSPYIDFSPWLNGVVVSNPDPLDLTQIAPVGSMTVSYMGGYGPVYGYSVTVLWNTGVATATFSKPADGPFAAGNSLFQVVSVTGGVRVDGTLFGSQPGIVTGDFFAAEFTAVGGEGTETVVDFTVEYVADYAQPPVYGVPADDGLVRVDTGLPVVTAVLITDTTIGSTDWVKDGDTIVVTATVTDGGTLASVTCDLTQFGGVADTAPDGAPVGDVYTWTFTPVSGSGDGVVTATVTAVDGLGNTASSSDDITADNTAPTAVTGVGALPGHQQIHLIWDDPSGLDANYAGVEFRYTANAEYPLYASGIAAAAADHAGGTLALQTTGTAVDWAQTTRDIYTLAAFAYDLAGNYGPADVSDGNWDAATSYFLGDTYPVPGGDGYVDIYDVSRLGDTYGLFTGDTGFYDDCDYGPTDDWSRFGNPIPDGEIGFFDLMIAAMNFGEVDPATKSDGTIGAPVFAWDRIDTDTWALALVNVTPGLKGLQLAADLPAGVTCTVSRGELLADQDAPVFLRNVARNGLDTGLAVLGFGRDIQGSGTLVLVKTSQPVEDLQLEISARDINNGEMLSEIQQTTGVPLPTVHALFQNFPNPFNPQTTIKYSLPCGDDVRLAVYGVDGRLVRVLVNDRREAGHHEVTWRGDDDSGRRIATGMYFYVIDAGDFHQVHKMSLVK